MGEKRKHVDDLRGASRLAVEATRGVVDLVRAMHETIGGGPAVLGRPLEGVTKLASRPIYGGIRVATDLVGAGIDVALAQLAPLLGESAPGAEREAVLATVNGVLGDYLAETGNPLAIEMELRSDGRPLELDGGEPGAPVGSAGRRLLVLVHGSCMNDRQWNRRGHDHGAALARDLGFTPLYLRYNSGMHISANGRAFAELLERLVSAWREPIDELVIVAHSMGGLVSRSACHHGEVAGHEWRRILAKLVCIGTPHHGAPLERGGNWIDVLLGLSRYSAPLGRLGHIRSAGVTDMRFGTVLDEDWQHRNRFEAGPDRRSPLPLPTGVDCYAIAGTTATAASAVLTGDGLVPVDSALGRCARPELALDFPPSHRSIAFGTGHLDLLDRAEVYETVRSWLA